MAKTGMALRWTVAGMMQAAKDFRRPKAHKQLPILKAALAVHQDKQVTRMDQLAGMLALAATDRLGRLEHLEC